MRNLTVRPWCKTAALALFAAGAAVPLQAPAAWEPTKTVEFIVPAGAGTGGGADQMARVIQGIIAKNRLMKQPMIVINKAGGAGAEGFLDVKEAKGDPNKIIITLSNLFTTPLATHTPFNWRDLTPVQMMALDNFVLWVNAETPYKTPKEYIAAVQAGGGKFKMGGTGSKQEDQIITVAIEKQTGAKFTYISYRGGGEVAVQLVGKHVDSTVNNPIEAVAQRHFHAGRGERRAGRVLRGSAEEGARDPRLEEFPRNGGVQPDHLERKGIRRLGGARGGAAHHAHEGSGLPGEMKSRGAKVRSPRTRR